MLSDEQMAAMGFERDPAYCVEDAQRGWNQRECGLQIYGTPESVGELLTRCFTAGLNCGCPQSGEREWIKPELILRCSTLFFSNNNAKGSTLRKPHE